MVFFKEEVINIAAGKGTTPVDQLNDCLARLKDLLNASGADIERILKQTVFVKVADNKEYSTRKNELSRVLNDFYQGEEPPAGFVAQPPGDGSHVALELILAGYSSPDIQVLRKSLEIDNGRIPYTIVHHPGFKRVYAAGLTEPNGLDTGTAAQAKAAFERMKNILAAEEMDFADVVRQWNYIENILDKKAGETGISQNYQAFNEVRAAYYQHSDFINGYPAATGIGMNAGGVILDFIGVKGNNNRSIIPIKNPRQVDAHRYSQEVLIGDPMAGGLQKAPPKFERAKYVAVDNQPQIYISGTAAILGQHTSDNEVEKQTQTTIENILLLISGDNLKASGIKTVKTKPAISYIRVYVKHPNDIPAVKQVCQRYFSGVPALYLISDICRDRLLVEIEAIT